MNIDAEKLVFLIEARSPIFNNKIKDHNNKLITEKLWEEIATEMNSEVAACKNKWINLRNSYSRYLREEKNKPSRSSGKQKRKWYLADAMSFLKEFVHQHRDMSSILPVNSTDIEEQTADMSQYDFTDAVSNDKSSPIPTKKSKTSISEMIAGPMIEFLNSRTKQKPKENGNELFFKSLLCDYEKLSSKRQRLFRMYMLNKMNQFQEEEENEYLGTSKSSSVKRLSNKIYESK
ncbi:uncharacterized protein LOC126751299 [Bactrocera neohumeralis]|uniref:uncharacterized protein LOC126751299 n=1 Tax=Bactrocera neohumeralis TaxID=98809 RepID=UPI0021652444|nr:uncharacterized protein LOC126751299 [Bactrocera neohumeralis]